MKKKILLLSIVLLGLASCQNEPVNTTPVAVSPVETGITAKTMTEFQALINANPNLVMKVKTSDLDKINENMTEQQLLSMVKLIDMPASYPAPNPFQKTKGDIITTLPAMTVYGSWPGISMNDWYFETPLMGGIGPCPSCVIATFITAKKRTDPLNPYLATALLPNFDFNNNNGKLKIGFEKVSNTQLKAFVGVTNGNNLTGTTTKGQVEFLLNEDGTGKFTSATFTKGSGSYTLNVGGASINVKSSNFIFTINPQGLVSNVRYDTTIGNYNIWAGGSQVTNSLNVGFTNTITKLVSTSISGGFDNGVATGAFKIQYGPLSAYISNVGYIDTGIEFSYKY